MTRKQSEFKSSIGVKWVKGSSGNTYLCPAGSLTSPEEPSEEELKRICVDESSNPQND